jgi:hypothetical protein
VCTELPRQKYVYTVIRVYFTAMLLFLLIKTLIIFNIAHPCSVLLPSRVVSYRRPLLTRNSGACGGIDFSVWQAVSDAGITGGSC